MSDRVAIRVFSVDDHALLREGIAAIIANEPGMELVAQAATGREAVDAAVTDHLANEVRLLSVLSDRDRASLDRIVAKLLGQFDHPGPAATDGGPAAS